MAVRFRLAGSRYFNTVLNRLFFLKLVCTVQWCFSLFSWLNNYFTLKYADHTVRLRRPYKKDLKTPNKNCHLSNSHRFVAPVHKLIQFFHIHITSRFGKCGSILWQIWRLMDRHGKREAGRGGIIWNMTMSRRERAAAAGCSWWSSGRTCGGSVYRWFSLMARMSPESLIAEGDANSLAHFPPRWSRKSDGC